MKKVLKVLRYILLVFAGLLFIVSIAFFFVSKFLLKTWPNLTMDELLFHMNANLQGTNPEIIRSAVLKYGLPAVLIIAAYIVGMVLLRKRKNIQMIVATVCLLVAVGLGIFSFIKLDRKLNITDYIQKSNMSSSFIEDNYADPKTVTLTFPETKRNVVYIYLESMEVTYADPANGGYFDENVIPELTALAQENEDFSGSSNMLNGGYSFIGTTYTMGALFGQTTGLPLKTGLSRNDMDTQEEFFPGATALGDILAENGYTNELMIGSKATFGGRALYFQTHGNYDIFDYDYAVEKGLIPENYYRWWGYEDDKLFTYAQSELLRLSKQGQPFNLTLLTVDTHFEDGYVCSKCGDKFGDNQYSNVFACSSCQVNEFVEWIQKQDFYENTTIIISGDHPTMDADYCEDVDEAYNRRVYTCYINSAVTPEDPTRTRQFSTLDDFPTTLAAMGVKIEGDRLGLGTNLFSSEDTLIEKYGTKHVEEQLSMKSPFLDSLNGIEITDTLLERIHDRSDIYTEFEKGSNGKYNLKVTVDSYTKLTAGVLIERLEVEVSYGDSTLEPVTLSGFIADGNIYYNETGIEVPKGKEITVSLYVVGSDSKRYHIKDLVSSSDNPVTPIPTPQSEK